MAIGGHLGKGLEIEPHSWHQVDFRLDHSCFTPPLHSSLLLPPFLSPPSSALLPLCLCLCVCFSVSVSLSFSVPVFFSVSIGRAKNHKLVVDWCSRSIDRSSKITNLEHQSTNSIDRSWKSVVFTNRPLKTTENDELTTKTTECRLVQSIGRAKLQIKRSLSRQISRFY